MFVLSDLPYDYSALEPYIDEETMRIHHDKHHATYVKNLNDALSGNDNFLNMKITTLLKNLDKIPEDVKTKVRNNGGGVANHDLFWKIMCPASESKFPESGSLFDNIIETFGSLDAFKEKFTAKALSHFGSGWIWLVLNNGKLEIIDSDNQDSPLTDAKPAILALDVWEHAYYLKYKNVRADYIEGWWNVVNWKEVERLYDGIR